MDKNECIKKAIEIAKGKYMKVGDIVGTEDEPRTWQLDAINPETCNLSIGEEKRTVSTKEAFNVRQVINIGNHLLNLGFWKEGLESTIITIGDKPDPALALESEVQTA